MQTTPAHDRSYLLRIWRADKGVSSETASGFKDDWRASLQAATTSQPLGFAGLEELFIFLINTMEAGVADHTDSFRQDLQD